MSAFNSSEDIRALLISGYIKQFTGFCNHTTIFMVVPITINKIIFDYYTKLLWDEQRRGPSMTTINQTAITTKRVHDAILLDIEIDMNDKYVHRWIFKIDEYVAGAWNPFIGLWKPYKDKIKKIPNDKRIDKNVSSKNSIRRR